MIPLRKRLVLNDPPAAPVGAGTTSGDATGEELQRHALGAIGAAATPAGEVDYARLRASAEWARAVESARPLQRVDLRSLGARSARLAFWVNVYNALVLHGVVMLGIRRQVGEVPGFFRRVSYRVGGLVLTLDEIEHGILRGNRRRPFGLLRPFGRRDPRRALCVDPMDPRIHFALNCGARSCPPVGVYRAGAMEQQLDLAARNFANQEVVLEGPGRIACSKIFRWYRADFDAAGGLAPLLLRYLDEGPVRAVIAAGVPPCSRWMPYHWALAHEPAE